MKYPVVNMMVLFSVSVITFGSMVFWYNFDKPKKPNKVAGKKRSKKGKPCKIDTVNIEGCHSNEKHLMKIKDRIEDFNRRVAFNLHSVDFMLRQNEIFDEKLKDLEQKTSKLMKKFKIKASENIQYMSNAFSEVD